MPIFYTKIDKIHKLLFKAMHLCKTHNMIENAMYDELMGSLDDALYYAEKVQEGLNKDDNEHKKISTSRSYV